MMNGKEEKRKSFCKVFLLCLSVFFLSGCGDRAVGFTLDTQKEVLVEDTSSEEERAQVTDARPKQEVADTAGLQPESREATVVDRTIKVYVCGAVKHPGVVELPEESRAEDALEAAGGLREDAGQGIVNLAAKLEDEQMLYFPTREEAQFQLEQQMSFDSRLVNINTAGVEELCTLPGIGASRAGDIIAYREAHGAFESIEDIMKVSGIKESLYEKICDDITVE